MKSKQLLWHFFLVLILCSCGSKTFMESYAPEESGLNVMKITDETNNTVLGCATYGGFKGLFAGAALGGSKSEKYYWSTNRLLSLSPDGSELAYITRNNKQDNIMIRKSYAQGAATQRTFRNISSFSWGADDQLYFSDFSDLDHRQIGTTDAHTGSLIRQLTNGNLDSDPVVSKDGSLLFFTRTDKSGPSVWSLDLKSGALTSCARGYNPCVINDNNESFICVRNNSNGMSEIWLVDFVKGQETLILSDKKRSYTNPSLSPDGKWIVCVGNSKSSISKKNNLDIFAVRTNGTNLTQLTYHPSTDCCPIFSADGKSIYFLSTRANKGDNYNIWKIRFDLK